MSFKKFSDSLHLTDYPTAIFINTFPSSLIFSFFLPLYMCDGMSLTQPCQQLLLSASTAQRNAKRHLTAAISLLPTMSAMYQARADMLLTLPATFMNIIEESNFTIRAEEVIAVLRDLCFGITLFKTEEIKSKDCRRIVSRLIESYHNKHHS